MDILNAEFHPHVICKYCPKCGSNQFAKYTDKAQKCNACGFEFYTNSAAAVVAIIVDNSNDILLTQRAHNPCKGMLDLPGGFVDPGETVEQALYREIFEELGLHITKHHYFGSFPNEYVYGGILYFTTDMAFVCEVADISTICVADDVCNYGFYPINEQTIALVGLQSIKTILRSYQNS